MKTKASRVLLRWLAVGWVVSATAIGLAGPTNNPPPVQTGGEKAREAVRSAVANGKDAIREGVQKTDEAITNAVHHIGVGAHKAAGVATNVAAKVKDAVTNAVTHVTGAVKDATR